MGFFRKSGVVFLSIILFFLLLAGGIVLTISLSLEHDNLQSNLRVMLKSAIFSHGGESNETNSDYIEMTQFCLNHTTYVFSNESGTGPENVPCTEVAKGQDAVVDFVLNDLIDKFYYQKYDCISFSSCMNVSSGSNDFPTYLLSEQFKDDLSSKFYIVLIFIVLGSVLLFFLVEKKTNFLFLEGFLILLSSLFLFGVLKILSGLINSLSSATGNSSGFGMGELFNLGLFKIFWIYFILGVLMIIAGITLKIVFYFKNKNTKE